MYSTCIGLILKGYNVFENSQNRLVVAFESEAQPASPVIELPEGPEGGGIIKVSGGNNRKSLKHFMDKIKSGLIEMFKEETEDTRF